MTEVNSYIKPKKTKIFINYALHISFFIVFFSLLFIELDKIATILLMAISLIAMRYTWYRIDYYKFTEIHFTKERITILKRKRFKDIEIIKEFNLSETTLTLRTIKKRNDNIIIYKIQDKSKKYTITSLNFDKKDIKSMNGMIMK